MGVPPNYPGSTGMVSPGVQYVNTMNQNQTVQDPNQQIRFLQGQQMNQGQRQVIPVQQRPPLMQQIQSGQQIMRAPIQQTQVFSGSPPTNQDNIMQDMQQPNSVQMVQNQQFVQIQRHNPPQMVNVSQHNGPHLIRTPSPQQVVYQHQGPLVGPHQRPVMQGMQQVMQPGTPIYNQQGQQVAVGPSQVQRVPQLRMQPNFQQMPRGQFRGPVQAQQVVTGGPPRNFIRQQIPVQGQLIPRQGPPPVQYSQHFSQQASHIGSQQPQPAPPSQQLHDQQHLIPNQISNQIPAQHPQAPHPHTGVQLETQTVQKPNQTLIRGQASQNWNQQWTPTAESPCGIPNQRLLIRPPSNNVLIAQQNGPGTPQILHSPQHDGARKQLPFGNQTPVRIMHTVGQRFPIAPNQVLPNGELISPVLPSIEPQPERLFGHEPRILVPPSFCLIGCIFYFVEAEKNICNVSEERLESCKKIVQKYGGEMENTYSDKCTHVICETQQNPIVQQAIKEGKRCVTIFWLNDIIIEGRMRPPYKIWHLPRTFDGDFLPCRDHIITLTNFEGTERVFVKELIKVTGAQYTNYLNHKNTIIICKKLEGPKFKKALQWDMPAVNLIWLQDILFGHHNQALSALHKSQRYTKFESKDCCEIDYNLVKPLLTCWKVPLKVPEDLPRRIMALKEEDVKKTPPPVPSTSPTPVQTNQSNLPLPPPPSLPPTPQTPSLPSAQQQSSPQQPPSLPSVQQQSPPTLPSSIPPSSSSATIEAMEIDQTLDASKPVPTLIAKKPDNPLNALASLDLNDKDSLMNEPTMKKVKLEPSSEVSPNENLTGNLPPPPPLMVAPFANASPDRAAVKVMFTGFNDASTLAELKEYAKKLGLTLINEYNKCTHLIVNRIVRTSKFMCAFNYADHILTSDWIVDSFKRSHLLDESQYILSDHKGEQLYGFDLKESLERRKARKTPLFKDHVFYITRSCLPSFKILKEIAESAGATVTKKGPSPKQLHALKKRRNDIAFVVISKEEDLHTCDLFFEKETPVLNSEFILHSLLRQQIEYEPYAFKPR
uniref:PAX-interacting protein 1 n=1 Tax=Tetranychus urticae TaxID=32264 RepID=T1K2U0_TETUR